MDIMMTDEDQSQANQPNSLAEGPPIESVNLVKCMQCCDWAPLFAPATLSLQAGGYSDVTL
eukprot:1149912-Pelagomonas_calceolata.AAC.2